MKKLLFIAIVLLSMSYHSYSQTPQNFNYQAIVRDNLGTVIETQNVSIRIDILQGSSSGTSVYIEEHFDTTNQFGLVNLQIGGGTPLGGDFATIDWGADIYFLQVELDETGGTAYQLMGVSQLLTVPVALHANTADSIVGGVTETDPVYDLSIASGITGTDTTNWNNKLDSYTETDPVYDLSIASGITGADTTNWNNKQDQITAGTGIEIQNNEISVKTYSIGDFAHGGVVFYVEPCGTRGLVCAVEDQNGGSSITWLGGGTSYETNAKGSDIYAGNMNTSIIIAVYSAKDDLGNNAALVCANYNGNDYGDWYLPAKESLSLMYQNKATINSTAIANGGSSFANSNYWSSTENSAIYSCGYDFFSNVQYSGGSKTGAAKVRAVRAF